MNISNKPLLTLATGTLVVLSALSTPVMPATDDTSRDVDKLLIVDCMLPGKVMRLGGGARYMSARRPVKTTGVDCEIRGGEYIAYDRASYASSLNVWLPDAKAGDSKAQTYVGEMFERGLGTTPDYATAVSWYRKAAEQGYDRAQMNLGSMYERGLGVEKDELEALNWYRKATGMAAEDDLVLGSELAAAEAEAEGLRVALATSQAEVNQLKENLNLSQRQMNNAQARLDSHRLELEEMRFRASQAQAQGNSGADVTELNREIQRKEAQLADNRKELANLRVEFDRQETQFRNQLIAQEDGQGSYQALLDLERQKIAGLEDQISQLTGGLESRQSELSASNAQLAALRRQLQAQAQNDQAATDASIVELSSIIENQQQTLEQKTQSIDTLQQDLERQRVALASEQTALQQREREFQQAAQSGTAEQQTALAQEQTRIATAQGQVAGLARELELKQSNLDQSNAQLAILTRQLEIANSKRSSSEQSMDELSEIINAQQADLEQKSLSISFLEQELSNQKNQLAEERRAYEKREQLMLEDTDLALAEKQALQTRLEENETYLSSSQQRLIESDRLIQRQEADILEQQNAIGSLKGAQEHQNMAQIRALESELGEKSIELARARGEKNGLINERDEMEREITRLRNQVAQVGSTAPVAMRGSYAPSPARPKLNIPVDFGNYYALIIGNNQYSEFPTLNTPVNDAWAIQRMLEDNYNFKTQVIINADRRAVLETINTYLKRLTEEDNFLLYYAGHGELDAVNNEGYWLPVDASRESRTDWISNRDITSLISTMNAKHVMVIADSCYSGTLTRGVRANLQGGKSEKKQAAWYEEVSKWRSRTALTSGGTQPVMDGGGGSDHSIFANSLLQTLESNTGILQGPDLYLEVFKRVRSSGQNVIGQEPTFDIIQNAGDGLAPFFFVPG